MFEGMGAFDMDPDSIQDMDTGQYGSSGAQPQHVQEANASVEHQSQMGQIPLEQMQQAAQITYQKVQEQRPVGLKAMDKFKMALTARHQAKWAAQQAELQSLYDQGKVAHASYEARMRKLMARQQPTFMNMYGTALIVGSVVVIGGIVLFITLRRKR